METPDRTRVRMPSWRTVLLSTFILGVHVLLIRWIVLSYQTTNCARMTEMKKELCATSNGSSEGCRLCPTLWILQSEDCYYYSEETARTWNQSRDHCRRMGADLLVIKTPEQQYYTETRLRKWSEDLYWIGLGRDGDSWRWVDGEQYNRSLFQIKTDAGRCVSISKSGYFQSSCSSKCRWICLKKAVRM